MNTKTIEYLQTLMKASELALADRPDLALVELERVDMQEGGSPPFDSLYIACLGQLGRFDELEIRARELLVRSPKPSIAAYRGLLAAAFGRERQKEGIKLLREALGFWPEDALLQRLWERHG